MPSAIHETTKNDSQIFESTSNNLSESHSESHRFDSRPMPYGFDKNSLKSDTLDDSMLAHIVQNPCGRDLNNFVRSSFDKEPVKRLLTLKSVLHDNQLSSYNSQQIKKIKKKL